MSSSMPSMFAANSAHRDVLDASIPATPQGLASLVEEVSSRARAAVAHKSWMDALLLYTKAIELSASAPLYSNRSLVHFQMNQMEESRRDAQRAMELDPEYIKGYWRCAQALMQLHRLDDAVEAIQEGLLRDPTNKAFLKELEKLQRLQKEESDLMDGNFEAETSKGTNPTKTMVAPSLNTTTNKSTLQPTIKSTSSSTTELGDVTDDFTKSDHVKGYKIVNGKKTSFFHNEMTTEVKELIGDIAPKRLEEVPASTADTTAAAGSSVWNKAGTWEERDITVWAKEQLQQILFNTTFAFPEEWDSAVASIVGTKIEGTASFATVRGKKRYIYEFMVTVDWKVNINNGICSGSMTFPDIDGTCELGNGYDMVDYTVKEGIPGITPLLERFVKNGGLRNALHDSVDGWVRLFKETY